MATSPRRYLMNLCGILICTCFILQWILAYFRVYDSVVDLLINERCLHPTNDIQEEQLSQELRYLRKVNVTFLALGKNVEKNLIGNSVTLFISFVSIFVPF